MIKKLEVNEAICDREVRLIDADGKQLGIMSARQALEIAIEKKYDLVKIAPQAKPPVCKLMDYGKYKYEMAKKEKEAKKNQKIINVKEIRLSVKIEENDINTKAKMALKFLKNGDKVKVSVKFKGRELGHAEFGAEVLNKFYSILKDSCVVDKQPTMEGRNMIMILSPKSN